MAHEQFGALRRRRRLWMMDVLDRTGRPSNQGSCFPGNRVKRAHMPRLRFFHCRVVSFEQSWTGDSPISTRSITVHWTSSARGLCRRRRLCVPCTCGLSRALSDTFLLSWSCWEATLGVVPTVIPPRPASERLAMEPETV